MFTYSTEALVCHKKIVFIAVLRSRSRHFKGVPGAAFFKAASAASFWQAKRKALLL